MLSVGGPWQVWALERVLREYSLVRGTVGRGITSRGSGLEGPRESQVGASSLIREAYSLVREIRHCGPVSRGLGMEGP